MLAGATLADPARIDIRGEVEVGRDVFIDVNAVLIGRCIWVRASRSAQLPHQRFEHRRRHGDFREQHHRSRRVVGRELPDRAVRALRPDTVLHHDVHIGNFVEIKNSEIGAGSKAIT
jgi:bifunctional UDP-N-acetylglucosamine pyrophosphorylase/glucosamine-1-phosphate N-acetyltransferase